ncbi:MAG: IS4 family transposase [Flavobacteriales bacterium]
MKVQKLLALIPVDLIEFLEAETEANHQVKKLHADIVFKLLLYSMVEHNKSSLRVMEAFARSAKFRHIAHVKHLETRYNSIRDRICSIDAGFFYGVFQSIFTVYDEYLGQKDSLVKVDSTVVGISSKLVHWSMSSGGSKGDKKHLKYSVAMKGILPCSIKTYNTSEMVNEDKALYGLIEESELENDSIVVFDRGVQSRDVFDKLSGKNQLFVGRLPSTKAKSKLIEQLPIEEKPIDATVNIFSDEWCTLSNRNHKQTTHQFRIIKAVIDTTGEEIVFITNSDQLSSYEVAALYKRRWEIEVFFKFIKQHLNFSHLTSRNENGIRVMMYMTMILAILLSVYKKLNKISSYKIAKLKFTLELDNLMTREIVILCGGDPAKAPHLFSDS